MWRGAFPFPSSCLSFFPPLAERVPPTAAPVFLPISLLRVSLSFLSGSQSGTFHGKLFRGCVCTASANSGIARAADPRCFPLPSRCAVTLVACAFPRFPNQLGAVCTLLQKQRGLTAPRSSLSSSDWRGAAVWRRCPELTPTGVVYLTLLRHPPSRPPHSPSRCVRALNLCQREHTNVSHHCQLREIQLHVGDVMRGVVGTARRNERIEGYMCREIYACVETQSLCTSTVIVSTSRSTVGNFA